MRVTGTVSDLDTVGGFGLIIADDGGDVVLFSVQGIAAALRTHIEVGSRVRFSRQNSEPAARAVEITSMGDWQNGGASLAAGLRP
jgi:cold shock CspA family protein